MQMPLRKLSALLVVLFLLPVIVVSLSGTGSTEANVGSPWQSTGNQVQDQTDIFKIFIPLISKNSSENVVGPPADDPPVADDPPIADDPPVGDDPPVEDDPSAEVGTGFEIDGNTALDMGGDFDWETVGYPPAVLLADPNSKGSQDETTFKPNGKFDEPENWKISAGKVGPPQTELTNLATWFAIPNSIEDGKPSDAWLIMAMERTAEQGSFYLDFEYNQVAWDGSNGGPTRTPGDLAVGYGILGNPPDREEDVEIMILQFFPGNQPNLCAVTPGNGNEPAAVGLGDNPCPPYGDSGWFYRFLGTGFTLEAADLGEAAVNDTPFAAYWPSTDSQGNERDVIGEFQFVEAALNLDALGIDISCSTFSSVHAKGRASLAIGSDLKDLVGPQELSSNCRIEGHKFLDVDGNGQWDQDEPGLEGWEIQLNGNTSTFTDENGFYSFEWLADGTYEVTEVCPADWIQTFPAGAADVCGSASYSFDINLDNPIEEDVDFGNGMPELTISKTVVNDECPADVFVGDILEYEVVLTNTGNVIVSDILVEDSLAGILDQDVDLAPGESKQYKYTLKAEEPGELVNVVTAKGAYGPALIDVPAEDTCRANVFGLDVSKDVSSSLNRIYLWEIEKSASDEGPIVIVRGDYRDIIYDVVVDLAAGGHDDSDWMVSGTITIDNPAPMDASLAEVRDEISDGIDATVSCPSLIVPAMGTLTCTYGPQELPNGDTRTNTAIAVLNNNNGETTDFTGSAEIDFAEADVDAMDESVLVTDSQVGELGTVRFDETPMTFSYSRTLGPYETQCEQIPVDNIAGFETSDTGTKGQDELTVLVFNVCEVRMGFEDLELGSGNDWDYNDLVIDVDIDVTLSDPSGPRPPDVLDVDLLFAQQAGPPDFTRRTHEVHTQPLIFTCDGTLTKTITHQNGVVDTIVTPYTRDQDILIYSNSDNAPRSVRIFIEFDLSPDGCPPQPGFDDPLSTFHGEALFFNPWMKIRETGEEVHPGDRRMLAVPDEWAWPNEKQAIWLKYPCVIPGDPPTFTPFWWLTIC